MAVVEATAWLACDADTFLAFVLDVDRYRSVDDKLGSIDWVRRSGDVTEFRFRPTLPGLPPAPKTVSRMVLRPAKRVDIEYAPPPHNRVARLLSDFNASFVCEPDRGGIRVTRRLSIAPKRPFGWLLDEYLRRRLQASVERELELAPTALGLRTGAEGSS